MSDTATIAALEMRVRDLERRLRMAFSFSRTTMPPDDTGVVQRVQARHSALELHDRFVRLQDYGFSSAPPVGTDLACLFMAGDRGAGIAFASGNQQHRPTSLGTGDSCLYDSRGRRIQLTATGVHVDAAGGTVLVENATTVTVKASTKIRFETPLLEVTGDIKDKCDTNGRTMAASRATYNVHTHSVIGVQTGGATVVSAVPSPLEE